MKIRYFKLKNWIILSLMSALGLNACHNTKDVAKDGHRDKKPRPRQEIMLLYGVPPVDYIEHVPDSAEGEDATPKDKGVAEETRPQVRQEQPEFQPEYAERADDELLQQELQRRLLQRP